MSTIRDGFITEFNEEGIDVIPAPPSPQESANVNRNRFASTGNRSTTISINSSLPSRDSVSAAIALVRAKQIAKSAIQRVEDQVLQPVSFSSEQTASSGASESSPESKIMNRNEVDGENAAPVFSQSGDNLGLKWEGAIRSSVKETEGQNQNIPLLLVGNSASSSNGIPTLQSPPTDDTNESDDFDEAVDAKTLDDVNAFLNRLGVGSLLSESTDADSSVIKTVDSIEKLRSMVSSSSINSSFDEMDNSDQSIGEVQTETFAEISAFIDSVTKKEEQLKEREQDEAKVMLGVGNEISVEAEEESESATKNDIKVEVSTSQTSLIYQLLEDAQSCKDPPSTLDLRLADSKTDPPAPAPSHQSEAAAYLDQTKEHTHHNQEEVNPFLDLSYRAEELLGSSQLPLITATVEEEKKIEVEYTDEDAIDDESYEIRNADRFFEAADVRQTLSTVEEVASVEAEDDDSADDNNDANLSLKEGQEENVELDLISPVVTFEEQESVYGADGRKEPKGTYEKADVEVEQIPMSNVGVEQNINSDMSVMSTDSQHLGNEDQDQKKTTETSGIDDATSSVRSQGLSETDSVPWALRDVASEETMRATGRRRQRFVLSGPRPSNKSRNAASLFDDTSIQASEATSELKNDGSFVSENESDDNDKKTGVNNEGTEIETSDSLEGDRCVLDNILYNDYESEDDYAVQRDANESLFSDESDEINAIDNIEIDPTESFDSVVAKTGEVEPIEQEGIEVVEGYGVCNDEAPEHTSSHLGNEKEEDDEFCKEVTEQTSSHFRTDQNEDDKFYDEVVEHTFSHLGKDEKEDDEFDDEVAEHTSSLVEDDGDQRLVQDPSGEMEGDQRLKLVHDPSGEMAGFEVCQGGVLSPTKATSKIATTSNDQGDKVLAAKTEAGLNAEEEAAKAADVAAAAQTIEVGALSTTKASEIATSSSDDQVDEKREYQHFNDLVRPYIGGRTPTLVEAAQLRQSAQRSNISLELVDNFLDDYFGTDLQSNLHVVSSDEWAVKSFHTSSFQYGNEDDKDVEAFLMRIEEQRIAAAEKAAAEAKVIAMKAISAVAADIEANFNAEEAAKAAAAVEIIEGTLTDEGEGGLEQNNSFLRQFEELDLNEDVEEMNESLNNLSDTQNEDIFTNDVADIMSTPAALINYFSTIDAREFEGINQEKLVKDFKRLMMPIIAGEKPTIIEEAQIRQAALKANVPLNYVDAIIDYVKDDHPELAPQLSGDTKEDPDFLLKGWEEIEDINEDAAIAAFLSIKFAAQALDEKKDSNISGDEFEKDIQEQKAKDFTDRGSHDYEPEDDSVTSTIEPNFKETKTEEETNCETVEYKMAGSDDNQGLTEGSKGSAMEEQDISIDFSNSIPKVVGTIKKQENDPIDMDMLRACKSIEKFDEGIWQRRSAMAIYGWEWKEATWLSRTKSPRASNLSGVGINGVAGAKDSSNFMFNKKAFPFARRTCRLPFNRRVKSHTGYYDVDVNSLQECAAFGEEKKDLDETPWELRHVRQRFLHERSLTFSRNWFGGLVKTSGNDKIKFPVCKPKSMEMPMRNIPDPGDWTPEWYTAWGGQKNKLLLPRQLSESSGFSDSESDTDREDEDHYGKDSLRSYSTSSSFSDDDEEWEDAPECGTLLNTKLKIGEHVSRVHPDYTSSLRKSRWRKKYFPIGTFPY